MSRMTSGSIKWRSSFLNSLQQTPRRPPWCLPHFKASGVEIPAAAAAVVVLEMAHTGGRFGVAFAMGSGTPLDFLGSGTEAIIESDFQIYSRLSWPQSGRGRQNEN